MNNRLSIKWSPAAKMTLRSVALLVIALPITLGIFHSTMNAAQPQQNSSDQKDLSTQIRVKAATMERFLVHTISPAYPYEAKKAHIEGKVIVDATIGTAGEVESAEAVAGPRPMQRPAEEAVRQWKYKPYMLNGKPVKVRTYVLVNFTLNR